MKPDGFETSSVGVKNSNSISSNLPSRTGFDLTLFDKLHPKRQKKRVGWCQSKFYCYGENFAVAEYLTEIRLCIKTDNLKEYIRPFPFLVLTLLWWIGWCKFQYKIFSPSILTHSKYLKMILFFLQFLCSYFNVKREITCQNVIKSQNAQWYKHTFFIVY